MALLSLVLINTGCEDRIDSSGVSGEKMVEVSLNIGIADEADGYDLSVAPASKAGSPKNSAFDMQLVPTAATRAVSSKPDKLYKLEIRQYDQTGTYLTGTGIAPTDKTIGETFTAGLQEATDCQLVFVAWGQNSSSSLGTGNLSSAQAVSIESSTIKDIQPNNMNTMPYVLHLKNVNVTSNGKITSPSGEDVRVLLKRLAARLTLTWHYNVADYKLKQILLQSIPLTYKVVAAPDKKDNYTYPSLLDQFTTIQLTESEIEKGTYSCWIPANVRGTNAAANSPLYRIKSNAPTGSAYASFIAVNTKDAKKKFDYRVYLGGSDYTDFNLYSNTDYSYTVNFSHTGLPVNDRRVTIIDPIPASESNNNIVPTANCFMVAPGGAFCFDPFVFQQNGATIDNTTLKGWSDDEGGIAYVKLIWQTKENGDVGDPVMGVANSADDHTNIVDIKMNNGDKVSKTSPVTAKDQARIYCRVAPNTTGGSGAIAAYNAKGEMMWSWHIWVTSYNPDARGDEDVQTPVNKRKLKFEYGTYTNNLPMMDRNLGAIAGYTDFPPNELEKTKTNGFYYQWGRKDPFIGSYSNINISKILYTDIKKDAPTKGLLSLFKEDGITFYPTGLIQKTATYREAYKDPANMYKSSNNKLISWISSVTTEYKNAWGAGIIKGIHDPCPAGWRVANGDNYKPLLTGQTSGENYYPRLKTGTSVKDGGFVIYYDKEGKNTTYFYLAGYWEFQGMIDINIRMHFWGGAALNSSNAAEYIYASENAMWRFSGGNPRESLLLRCIQEQK